MQTNDRDTEPVYDEIDDEGIQTENFSDARVSLMTPIQHSQIQNQRGTLY